MRSEVVARVILGWSQDDEGVWVAALDCGHRRHVRHRPPLASAAWVQSAEGRASRIGAAIECGRCVSREWPEGVEAYKVTPDFDQDSVPKGLLASHTTKKGTWGRLEVLAGSLELVFESPLDARLELTVGDEAAIPPQLPHHLELHGAARFRVRFFRRRVSGHERQSDRGGRDGDGSGSPGLPDR